MKISVTIARILTGVLFIFSGLVKAIDPRGLAYKMQEFFEAWANGGFMKDTMGTLGEYALAFSIIMITLEVVVGLAILLGWQKKIMTWVLFLLILFFTFLTSYVLFSGKIRACGCFGDCIPITPTQTFTKDIILLLLSLWLLINQKYILPAAKPLKLSIMMFLATAATLFLQWYVLRHLPVIDCLPFKKGNNIIALRKMPADAVPDEFEINFVYQKNGEKKEFGMNELPDSSWEYVDRTQKLVKAGSNNVPLINDFNFVTFSGNDTTEAILNNNEEYYLLFINGLSNYPANWTGDAGVIAKALSENRKIYIITSSREAVKNRLQTMKVLEGLDLDPIIFTTDATAIKTAARANPTLYLMKGPVVVNKKGWADF